METCAGRCGCLNPPDLPARASKCGFARICHNDLGPFNMVFGRGQPVGMIDWNNATLGLRVWDAACATRDFREGARQGSWGYFTVPTPSRSAPLAADLLSLVCCYDACASRKLSLVPAAGVRERDSMSGPYPTFRCKAVTSSRWPLECRSFRPRTSGFLIGY